MVSLIHAFVSAKGDGADATLVQPSNWNAEHTFETSATDKVLGRASAGAGAVEEIACTQYGRGVLAAASYDAIVTLLGAATLTGSQTLTNKTIDSGVITGTFGGALSSALDGAGYDVTGIGVLTMVEQAAAEADVAGRGQLWVKTATPNELWFTDDAGNDYQIGVLNKENQPVSGGASVTVKDLGEQTSGTLTLDMGDRPMQKAVNGGAFTLAPGTTAGVCILTITNNGSAGAITTSGWTAVTGDSFDTTNTNKFRCHCCVDDDGDSTLVVQAMQ